MFSIVEDNPLPPDLVLARFIRISRLAFLYEKSRLGSFRFG
jgi:hypothetical protein